MKAELKQIFQVAILICFICNYQAYAARSQKFNNQQLQYSDSLKQLINSGLLTDSALAIQYNKLAWFYRTLDNNQALSHLMQALTFAEKLNSPYLKAYTYNQIGVVYQIKADYRKALWYHLNALKMFRNLNMSDTIAVCFNLGSIYLYLGKFEIAKNFFLRSKDAQAKGQKLADWFGNMGVVESQLGNMDKAIQYYKQAIAEINRSKEFQNAAITYINLTELYISIGNINEARENCLKAFKYCKNDPYYEIGAFQMMGKIETLQKNYDAAETYLFKARNTAISEDILLTLPDITNDIARIYEEKGNFKKALAFHKMASTLKDSSLNQTFTKQLSEMQASHDAERKDEEINKLNQLSLEKTKQEKLRQYLWITLFIFILTICAILIRNTIMSKNFAANLRSKNIQLEDSYIALNASKDMIEEQNKRIEEINLELSIHNTELKVENKLAQFEVLKSKTNPHFLFNSLASLSAIVKDNETASEFLERFIDLYRQILESSEHKLVTLQEEMEVVNNYLYLEKVRFEDQIEINIHINSTMLSLFLPPFALQIIVENTLKHNIATDKRKLKIHVFTEDEKIIVRNNLQKKTTPIESTKIGQRNVLERYQILTSRLPLFIETGNEYIVELPLLRKVNTH